MPPERIRLAWSRAMASRGEPIWFRDRESGAICEEPVAAEGALRALYGAAWGRALADRLLATPALSAAFGAWQRAPWTRRRIAAFVRALGIDASEAEKPIEAYPSLNAFFARRLKPGARPIDGRPEHFAAPCDGRVLAYPDVGDAQLAVKGQEVGLETLFGDAARGRRGGAVFVFRLAPMDYHRFHFPDGGRASNATRLGGRLHSVHPIALAGGAPSFENQRWVSALASDRFGEILIAEVGALFVGRAVQTYAPGRVERGEEKGYFEFGASTIAVWAPPGRVEIDADLAADSRRGLETFVKMGTRVGRAPGAPARG